MSFEDSIAPGQLVNVFLGSWSRIFISPMTGGLTLHMFQNEADIPKQRAYNVQYPEIRGITASKTLSVGPGSYLHTVIHFTQVPAPRLLGSCITNGVQTHGAPEIHSQWCFTDDLHGPFTLDYYTTQESGSGNSGFMFHVLYGTLIPPLRAIDGAIVATEFNPSPADYRIASGEEITVGSRPLFPRSLYGTTNSANYNLLITRPGFHGPFGDWDEVATHGTAWTLFDSQNAMRGAGAFDLTSQSYYNSGPMSVPGGRFVAARDGLKMAGLPSRADLEVQFGDDGGDLVAPTLTSLRIVDHNGRLAEQFDPHAAAALVFSAADFDYPFGIRTLAMKTEATRVSYRFAGTSEWRPLAVVFNGSDTGSFSELGRLPAGDLYRADLSPATIGGAVDLRIEVEDVHGNRTTWTQSPAFMATAGPRRRATR